MQGTFHSTLEQGLQPDHLEDLLAFQSTTSATSADGKSPNQTDGYSFYAVRRGKRGLRSCIFRHWQDCEKYVDGYNKAEYSTFDKIDDALDYINIRSVHPDSDVEENQSSPNESDSARIDDKDAPRPSTEAAMPIAVIDNSNIVPPPTIDTTRTNPVGAAAVPANFNTSVSTVSTPVIATGLVAASSMNSTSLSLNSNNITAPEIETVDRGATNMTEPFPGIASLQTIQPTNPTNQQPTLASTSKTTKTTGTTRGQKALANPNRRPTKIWYRMFENLKNYKEKHGTIKIDLSKENTDLRRWVKQQHNDYKFLKEGKPSGMFKLKIDKLKEVGFEFRYVAAHERIEALLEYKKAHGNYNVPRSHPTLGKWVEDQKALSTSFISGNLDQFFESRINELKDLTVKYNDQPDQPEKKTHSEDNKWNDLFQQLIEYKKTNNNCEVPPSLHTPLSYWVTKQHQEYQKIKDGSPSRLTLERMQKLIDIGFVFRQVKNTLTWEERMEQLQKYKEEHGNTRVPKSHPELGVFVNRQRYEYSKWIGGRPSSMNDKRHKDLQDLGFVFVAGKKMDQASFQNKKTWDERYAELLQYRQLYGHVIVPQSFPGLGEWVHTQVSSWVTDITVDEYF